MKIDLKNLTIARAHEAFRKGDFTATDLAQAYLDRIKEKNGELNAYLEVYDNVLVQAGFADKAIAAAKKEGKEFPPLLGIPVAVKDNILVKGMKAGAASKILENYTVPYDAMVIRKLQVECGAVLLGRTNMDEFAMGGSTENSAYGVTKNPHDLSRVAGGSSGGSAAAVAADLCLVALGSDTGGSIRQPASFCGVVGMKPTYGAVSRHGLMAMGSSLDQIGPFAKTVEDAEILYKAIAGHDPLDSTTLEENRVNGRGAELSSARGWPRGEKVTAPASAANRFSKGSKPIIGIPRHFLDKGLDPSIKKNLDEAIAALEKKGYEIRDVSLPNIAYSLPVYYVIMPAEVSSNMARFDGVKYGLHADGRDGVDDYFATRAAGFGPEVRRRILLGTYVLSSGYYDAYYNRANAVRRLITEDFRAAFKEVDLILTPTAPSPAFRIGEKTDDPVAMYLEDIFTVPANLTGMPAISVPTGCAEVGGRRLPIGMQLAGQPGGEAALFAAAKDLETGARKAP